jgi:hypothetical protein
MGGWTYRVSAAGVLVLAAAAFTLSYDALHQLALDSRVRPGLAWLWPVVIDGTIVVAPADRARGQARRQDGRLSVGAGRAVFGRLGRLQRRPRARPAVARLVFAMAPVALVLTTHLLMQQASWRPTPDRPAAHEARSEPAHPHTSGDHPAPRPAPAGQGAQAGARARVRAAYQAQLAAGQTPTGAGLARAAGVSERYGQRLLAEFTADRTHAGHSNGDGPPAAAPPTTTRPKHGEGR